VLDLGAGHAHLHPSAQQGAGLPLVHLLAAAGENARNCHGNDRFGHSSHVRLPALASWADS
jgi:hypothetical protein